MKFFKSEVKFLAKVYYYSTSLVKRVPGAGAREIDVSIKLHYVFPTAAIVERADTKERRNDQDQELILISLDTTTGLQHGSGNKQELNLSVFCPSPRPAKSTLA